MPIAGLSERRRLPRAGIIRLGIKKKNSRGNEYPVETDYFVCPEIVQEVYGKKPKQLLIMFPVEDENMFFQQFYKCYGNGILLCRGDGETGTYWDFKQGDFRTRSCPCQKLENGKCKAIGILQFMLPEVKESIGAYQISTGSKNSIIDINSGIDIVRSVAGRVAMIPLILKRELTETQRMDGDKVQKGKHYTLKLSLAQSLVEIQKLAQRPASQALLPNPDESSDAVSDLLLNGRGDKEEPEEVQVVEEPEENEKGNEEIKKLAEKLDQTIVQFEEAGGKVTADESKRIKQLQTAAEYQSGIDYFENKLQEELEKNKGEEDELPF